jgi:hypothetical protein
MSVYDSNTQKVANAAPEKSKSIEELKKNKFWKERIKFDTPLALIFLPAAILGIWFDMFMIKGFDAYMQELTYLTSINLVLFYFFLFLGSKIYKSFLELDIFNPDFFYSAKINVNNEVETKRKRQEIFNKYMLMVSKFDNNKIEKYIPVIAGLLFGIISFFIPFNNYKGATSEITFLFLTVMGFVTAAGAFLLVLTALSSLIILVSVYILLNQLGSDEFPLNIDYTALKTGRFETIGIFILSFTIPTMLLGTILGIFGLPYILMIQNYLSGFVYMSMGLSIAGVMAFLLYKCTVEIHHAISDTKENLMKEVAEDIQKLHADKNYNRKDKYKELYNMNFYYETLESINDWPFNPASFRKLLITLSSSVLPFALSIFGLV